MPFPRLADEHGWPVTVLDAGHDAMVTAPHALAGILLQDARGS